MTRINLFSVWLLSTGPTISTPICSKGVLMTGSVMRGTSLYMPGQKNLLEILIKVFIKPRWPAQGMVWPTLETFTLHVLGRTSCLPLSLCLYRRSLSIKKYSFRRLTVELLCASWKQSERMGFSHCCLARSLGKTSTASYPTKLQPTVMNEVVKNRQVCPQQDGIGQWGPILHAHRCRWWGRCPSHSPALLEPIGPEQETGRHLCPVRLYRACC